MLHHQRFDGGVFACGLHVITTAGKKKSKLFFLSIFNTSTNIGTFGLVFAELAHLCAAAAVTWQSGPGLSWPLEST